MNETYWVQFWHVDRRGVRSPVSVPVRIQNGPLPVGDEWLQYVGKHRWFRYSGEKQLIQVRREVK
jgi:hypothetical protein